jgi:hypothetical protein
MGASAGKAPFRIAGTIAFRAARAAPSSRKACAAGGQQRRAEQAGLEEGSAGGLHTLAFVFFVVYAKLEGSQRAGLERFV